MSPSFALTICVLFVIFLLNLDRKQAPSVSFSTWIPTIWLLVTASKPLGVWLYLWGYNFSGNGSIEEGSQVDRVFLFFCLLIGVIILSNRKFNWFEAIKENKFLVFILGYLLLSGLSSDIPFISFKRWSREIITVVMAFMLRTENNPREAVFSIFRRIVYICIPFSYILINYFGDFGRIYVHNEGLLMWTGVAMHKNSLAQLCIISFTIIVFNLNKKRNLNKTKKIAYLLISELIIFIITIWLLLGPYHSLTYSATSSITLIVWSLIFCFISLNKSHLSFSNKAGLISIVFFLFIYGTYTPIVGKLSLVDISEMVGRSETITGRDAIWKILVPLAMNKPMFGYGFGGFWTTNMRELATVIQSHNGYLDIVLNIGFIGLFLFLLFFVNMGLIAVKEIEKNFYFGAYISCFLIVVLVHNIAESSIASFTSLFMATLIFYTIAIPKNNKDRKITDAL